MATTFSRRGFLLGSTALTLSSACRVSEAWTRGNNTPTGKVMLNLLGLADAYTSPFINQAKLAPDLFLIVSGTGYHANTSFGNSPWGLFVDANGQPNASIPGCTEIAIAFFTPAANLSTPPAGFNRTGQSWVATWDGDPNATAVIDHASSQTQVGARVNWVWGDNTDQYDLTFTNFDATNCPRNIRVFKASNETLLNAGEIFDPDYVAKIKQGAGRIRFMQWQQTIGSPNSLINTPTFASIPTESFYSWQASNALPAQVPGGLPVSLIYKLANKANKHPYINFTHMLGNGKNALITNITNANPAVVTAPGHNFANGDQVVINLVSGMTQINNQSTAYTVANANMGAGTFQLSGIDSTSYGTFNPGSGTVWSAFSLSGMTTEVGKFAAAMRDNLNGGLYTCYEFDNEAWNDTTQIWFWIQAQNQIWVHGGPGSNNTFFWGYLAAHCMRTVYDTYGASNRSKWKGMLATFLPVSGTTSDLITGVNQYITDNPSYTIANLFDEVVPSGYWGSHTFQGDLTPQTVTMTIASPCVVTFPGGFLGGAATTNAPVKFTTTGALPTGLTAGTIYWIINISGNTCNLAATQSGAAINTTGSQSGTQTATVCEGDISLGWITTGISKFNAMTEPTRYSWFNKQVNINSKDGSLSGNYALFDCVNGLTALWQAHQTIATAAGINGISQYEGGNSAFLYGFGSFVSVGVTLTLANPCVLTMSAGNAPAAGTPVTFVTTGALPSSITGGPSGLVYYVINPSGATCNLAATVGGAAISTASESQSGSHTLQGAYAEFWPFSLNTAEDGANYTAMFNNFAGIGGIFPSKYGEAQQIVPENPGLLWGALQFLGAGVNDDTPVWDAIASFNAH